MNHIPAKPPTEAPLHILRLPAGAEAHVVRGSSGPESQHLAEVCQAESAASLLVAMTDAGEA